MRKVSIFVLVAMCAALVLAASTRSASAKEKKMSGPARWHGALVRISEDGSVLTVRKANVEKAIHVNADTKWTKVEKGKSVGVEKSEIKEGDDLICLGVYDDKGEFVATRVDKRLPR